MFKLTPRLRPFFFHHVQAERMAAGRELKHGPKPMTKSDVEFKSGGWGTSTMRRFGMQEEDSSLSFNPQVSNDSESFVFGFPLNFN